ncbi:MAG: hypothetical protein HOL07_09110 [Rhodospirillaceae bacterium]|nr:hypothetical protein [Rhodospirillaceae bacterium]MBT5358497.1 hypothetical protein [Rhodospirillaceae bacterium]MBT5770634.1 hypothetical protein [Rhodospirillaceae bacterium]MBT6309058.1 hypothetical protein [Rhodospirillaceae bacterium]MBT7364755.1 hypothetical protein [Rhodospirillaceae bacterium]
MSEKVRQSTSVYALAAVFAVAFGVYGFGLSNSPLMSDRLAARQDHIRQHYDLWPAEVRASAYWERNPDVRADAFFGEGGAQGIFGAWVHYERHGIYEGRRWGP